MAYQAPVTALAWGGQPADAAYAYQQYYASYANGYDYSAYYQQQQQQAQSQQGGAATDAGLRAPPPPSSPPPPGTADTEGGAEKPPPPPPDVPPPPPSAAPPDAPPAAAATDANNSGAAANIDYNSPAYAQWYAQTYGGYYGGYDQQQQQQHAYWQQQQQQQQQTGAYGYGAQAAQRPQPAHNVPPPAPPKGDPPAGLGHSKPVQHAFTSAQPYSGLYDSYNAQAPPLDLYDQQHHHHNQHARQRAGLTGTNNTPMGPRPPPGDPPAASASATSAAGQTPPQHQMANRFRVPTVIRPQLPGVRANASAAPAYISVASASSLGGTASSAANGGASFGVAASVAAGVASAAAAAAKPAPRAAAAGSAQWPPSFTAWVTRCFNAARVRAIPDGRLSEKLMAYLDHVKAEGRLWTTDWDTQPVMLPDGQAAGDGARAAATSSGQALSPTGPQGRKRSRWGAVPEDPHAGQDSQSGYSYRQQRGGERSQDVDSDEDDHGQYGGGSGYSASPMKQLSNRKRKKMLQLEQQQTQQQRNQRGRGGSNTAEDLRRQARAGRFGDGRAAGAAASGRDYDYDMDMDSSEEDEERRFGGVVVGTCTALEKSYFRLTSQPEPSSVRPEPVLDRALSRLVRMIARGEATYFYSLDQFKGMRQDCTVQHLRNALAVRVYEAHGRSSLEYGDTAEFNQCQARLGHLYGEGQPGCGAEFTAYRLLYETVHCASAGGRGGMAKALLHTMRNVPQQLAAAPEIKHALQVREAVMTHSYAAFFRLYATAPHLGRAILDVVVEPVRWSGLNAFVKACELPVPVAAMAQLLGFAPQPAARAEAEAAAVSDATPLPGCMRAYLPGEAAAADTEEEGVERCAAWLQDHGAVVVDKGSELLLDTKASRGKLFVPEVTAKVETGDLSLTDFLSRARGSLAE